MTLSPFAVHRPWLIRAVLVLLATVLADGIVAWLVKRPLPWVTLIGSSLPLSMFVFVAIPLLRERNLSKRGEEEV